MPSVLPYCLPHAVLMFFMYCHESSNRYAAYFPLVIVWVIFPVVDNIFPCSSTSLSHPERRKLEGHWSFSLILFLWVPLQFTFILSSCMKAAEMNWETFLLSSLSAGLVSAGGINVAHEFLHRRNNIEVSTGELLLISVCYGHFTIEHNYGHHKNVGTKKDPATFRFNETFYSFLPRSIFMGYASAFNIDSFSTIRYTLSSLIIVCSLHLYAGKSAVVFFLLQASFAIVLLEQVNAIEHYGLTRKEDEPVQAQHSWDTHPRISNFLLFKLQNHADHHMRKFNYLLTAIAAIFLLTLFHLQMLSRDTKF